jgi:hypothetical protein
LSQEQKDRKPLRVLVADACKAWASTFQNKNVEYDYNRSRAGGYQADQNYPPVKALSPITDEGPPPAPKPPQKKEEPKKEPQLKK